jgi:putative transposase
MTASAEKTSGTGVPPVQSFKITRRNLPHWQQPGKVYFLTWRCKKGEILSPEERTITLGALKYWDGRKWTLYAAVIMSDHVHVLVQPLAGAEGGGVYDLAEIIHSVKSFSVHQINRQRGSQGFVWQDERFDRIVRDEAEFLEKWNYIRNNPMKAALAESPEDYPWLYERT